MRHARTWLSDPEAGADTDTPSDTNPVTRPAATSPVVPLAAASSTPNASPTKPSARPRPTAAPAGRPAGQPDKGEQIAALRTQDPTLTTEKIAERLGCSDRTVRRYLAQQRATAAEQAEANHGADGAAAAMADPQPSPRSATTDVRTTHHEHKPERTSTWGSPVAAAAAGAGHGR
jgi:methylphosphotriester-DNA--protein-cysteine methyltransferase